MHTLLVLEAARQEWFKAVDYYEFKQKGLGERFLKAVVEHLEIVTKTPKHYKKIKKEYRQISIKQFPFLIIYRINESNKTIVIISIFHSKRHPKTKFRND